MLLLFLALLGSAHADEADSPRWTASHQVPQVPGLMLRWDPARSWGSGRMVDTLRDVAQRLAFELPHADPLLIGDVSKRGGGRLAGHITHHVGIDADIGLFTGDGEQPLGGFMDVHPRKLDAAANWALIRALLDTERVQFILLDQTHIDRIESYARNVLEIDEETLSAIFPDPKSRISWDRFGVVRHAPNHRSHVHVRVADRPGT